MLDVYRGWIDNKNLPSENLKFGDFSEIPVDILEDVSNFADRTKAAIPWKSGDFVVIDNEMTMHSR